MYILKCWGVFMRKKKRLWHTGARGCLKSANQILQMKWWVHVQCCRKGTVSSKLYLSQQAPSLTFQTSNFSWTCVCTASCKSTSAPTPWHKYTCHFKYVRHACTLTHANSTEHTIPFHMTVLHHRGGKAVHCTLPQTCSGSCNDDSTMPVQGWDSVRTLPTISFFLFKAQCKSTDFPSVGCVCSRWASGRSE